MRGGEGAAQQVVEEEVVQLVAAQDVLGLLLDFAALVRRQQLGADRRVHNVAQDAADLVVKAGAQEGDHFADHRLGQADVDVVVGQMVAAEGAPAQRVLGHVAGADHDAAAAVGHVHQNLVCARAPGRFHSDVPQRRVVADVLKVLRTLALIEMSRFCAPRGR